MTVFCKRSLTRHELATRSWESQVDIIEANMAARTIPKRKGLRVSPAR